MKKNTRKEAQMRTPLEKNLSPISRTLSEAKRDARYACAIQTFRSDTKLALDFIGDAILGFVLVGTVLGSVCGLIYIFLGGV